MPVTYGSDYGLPTLDLNFARNKTLNDTITGRNLITFTRSSTGTYVGADGLIKTAATNEARFDHNPTTGESLGLLVEEQRTNYIYSSNPAIASGWATAATFSTNQTISPDGTSINSLTNNPRASNVNIGAVTKTLSFFVKADTNTTGSFTTIGGGWGADGGVYNFNLAQQTFDGGTVRPQPNGWFRLERTFTSASSGTLGNIFNCNGLYLWGVQFEAGSFPTSYIPTTSSTVTRSADVASITGTNFSSWYNQSAGSMFTSGLFREDGSSGNYTTIALVTTGSTSATPSIGFDISSTGGFLYGKYNGGALADSGGLTTNLTSLRLAMAMQTNDAGFSRNGETPITTSSLTTRSDADRLLIGSGGVVTGNPANFNGTMSRLTYYPKRLPNYQLQALTR